VAVHETLAMGFISYTGCLESCDCTLLAEKRGWNALKSKVWALKGHREITVVWD